MNATDWLNWLEAKADAATPGNWESWHYDARFLCNGGQGIVTRIETQPLDPDNDKTFRIFDSPDISVSNAAYIVAACNAVPRLIDMLRFAAGIIEAQATINNGGNPATDAMQALYNMTEQKQ